jgi:hypothetical protein
VQVERVREIEVGEARLAEAARWRQEMRRERAELERLYGERVKRLREQEEALMSRAREQQRDVERAAFEHRQRLIEEDSRLREWQNVRRLSVLVATATTVLPSRGKPFWAAPVMP